MKTSKLLRAAARRLRVRGWTSPTTFDPPELIDKTTIGRAMDAVCNDPLYVDKAMWFLEDELLMGRQLHTFEDLEVTELNEATAFLELGALIAEAYEAA